MRNNWHKIVAGFLLMALMACNQSGLEEQASGDSLFTKMPEKATGVDFANDLAFRQDFNIYTYRNYYNGGGVALGDVNGDGLTDMYFSGNLVDNRLYINKGDFQFEDVTEKAGVAGSRAWSTGVTMADVNADGLLDIYVCNSGDIDGDNKQNELFINQGDGTFSEEAEKYGIADQGFSTHGVFFDYDRDGDLDLYLLNNSYQAIGSFNLQRNERPKRDPVGGDKLYQNQDGKFVDVSEAAGIYGSIIGFGLGVTVGDVDRDDWPDIYVSNDFFERDYLYINNQDGTFREELTDQIKSLSAASMGADLADINNDGYGDIFVTEMLPETNQRIKTSTTFENWNRYQYNLKNDYYHQFTRNMLQRNNGDGTFSEIGRLAGVEASDWSWGALIFDMDNDGYKDIFVANGIYQDLTNQDFLNFIADDETKRALITKKGVDYQALVDAIPSNPVPNYAFQNLGPDQDFRFQNQAEAWGLDLKGFSNGSAYGDLDNDGDLDLVVNNVNAPAAVYRNESRQKNPDHHFLQLKLKGGKENPWAIGTKAWLVQGDRMLYLEHMPMRGFQSSIDYRLHFGLGELDKVDSLVIEWYDGQNTVLQQPTVDQILEISYQEAVKVNRPSSGRSTTALSFSAVKATEKGISYSHQENTFSDFDRDGLIYHMRSAEGPKLCEGDFNGDGRTDFYIGGSAGYVGAMYIQLPNGNFKEQTPAVMEEDKASEDLGCACFDADGDGDDDLYIASGGNEFSSSAAALLDRLYFNQGGGQFKKGSQPLPGSSFASSSCVEAADYDGDGDLDLFVGGRLRPFLFGVPTDSYLLENDGQGQFRNVAVTKAPGLRKLGLVTDARWVDIDADQDPDLILVGEWMAPKVFINNDGQLAEASDTWVPENLAGWWNAMEATDLDGDGDTDFILANHGLNSRFRASADKPISMYVNDFDQNGTAEQIISVYNGDKSYPLALMHDLVKQMPGLRKKYLKYESFEDEQVSDIFDTSQLNRSLLLEVQELRSIILWNEGDKFRMAALPIAAQETPLYAFLTKDVNQDGRMDILAGGNFYYAKPEVGRYDASFGLCLIQEEDGSFRSLNPSKTGFYLDGEVRDMAEIDGPNGPIYLITRNNDQPLIFRQ